MLTQDTINYNRVAEAIAFIQENFKGQPNLEAVANHIHLSPDHFQRLFTEWAGTSPKKFLQYISVEHAKNRLQRDQASLFDTALDTGLSSTSRLHELFVNIEGMTPAEFKNGGEALSIHYSIGESTFGTLFIASTSKGICHMAFETDPDRAIVDVRKRFPNARFLQQADALQQQALAFFQTDWSQLGKIKLHLRGTPFQLKVWEALLKIPMGSLSSYGAIAQQIGSPNAARAVGSAIGSNPIAFLIPCHRVIQASGTFGGYMWGPIRKTALIGWESAQTDLTSKS